MKKIYNYSIFHVFFPFSRFFPLNLHENIQYTIMANSKAEQKNTKKKDKATTNAKAMQESRESIFSSMRGFWKGMNGEPSKNTVDGMSNAEITRFCIGAILFIVSCFILLSITSHIFTAAEDSTWVSGQHARNWMGTFGLATARFFIDDCWGVSSFLVPLFLLVTSLRIMQVCKVRLWKWFLNCSILMIWFSAFAHLLIQPFMSANHSPINISGSIGANNVSLLNTYLGVAGTYLVLIAFAIGYLIYLSKETIIIIRRVLTPSSYLPHLRKGNNENPEEERQDTCNEDNRENDANDNDTELNAVDNSNETDTETATTIEFTDINDPCSASEKDSSNAEVEMEIENVPEEEHASSTDKEDCGDENSNAAAETMTIHKGKEEEQANLDETRQLEPYDPKLDLENYQYPTIDLLKHYEVDTSIDMEEQQQNKNRIIQVLSDFGVKISSIKATVGPTITLYEITPAPGVRISKIRNLEDDIALSLSALGIRIIAPIPGKGTIGIEVPNARPQIVSMESIINSRKFQETQFELPMALGKTITNEIYMVDLAKMPHLLVAGATGQGKSVGLNAIITSLLYKKHPAELKLVMVDPKKVEFSVYAPIVNHFLAQVEGNEDNEEAIITDVQKVVQTLKSLCVEMDNRYDLLKKAGARNLREYNEKFKSRRLNPENGHRFMPYIVVIIDEFGDLIMTAGKEIELPICRIAQLARAVGIHMIIATQRPTTNIITGTIKANFPARMAFKVSAMVDSRTILDRAGAQQLVGKGDMLVLGGGSEPVRVQCAFVDTPEVERITHYIACQQSYLGPAPLPPVALDGEDGNGPDVDMQNLDPMFEEVARLVVQTQQGSTSMIQRKFSIGYNRAGRLMDQLEVAGIVGPAHGSKPREVLCLSEEDLQMRLDNMH